MNEFSKTLLVCWFGVFTTSIGLSQIAPILPIYIRYLGVSDYNEVAFYSGLCFGVTPLLVAVFSPIWGFMTTRYGCKIMLLRASIGMAILTLLLAFAQNIEQIIILRALTGVVAGFTSSATIFIVMISNKRKVTYALATLSTASVSGNLIGPLFGGLIYEFTGVRVLFAIIAALLFCSFLTILLFIKQNGTPPKQSNINAESRINIPFVLILFVMTFIVQAGLNAVIPIMALFVEQIRHNNTYIALWTGIVVAASGISNIIFAPKIGRFADKIGPNKIIVVSLTFCGVIFYLQSLVDNIYTLILLRLLLGAGLGGLMPCINAMFKKNVSSAKIGMVLGFNQSAFALGNFTGSFGGGIIASQFGIKNVFTIVFVIFMLYSIIFYITQQYFIQKIDK